MDEAYIIPHDMVLIGTCGACGGPVLSPQIIADTGTASRGIVGQCTRCQRHTKPEGHPLFGPIREMQ